MNFLRTIFYCFTTWLLTSLVNGLACGCFLNLAGSSLYKEGGMGLSVVFSFIFSIPGMFIFWIYFLYCLNSGKYGRELFMHLLYATFFLSLLSGILLTPVVFANKNYYRWGITLIVVASSMTVTFIHRSIYLTGFKKYGDENDV